MLSFGSNLDFKNKRLSLKKRNYELLKRLKKNSSCHLFSAAKWPVVASRGDCRRFCVTGRRPPMDGWMDGWMAMLDPRVNPRPVFLPMAN